MKNTKVAIGIILVILLSLSTVGMASPKKDPLENYLGMAKETLPTEVLQAEQQYKIDLVAENEIISEIRVRDKAYQLKGITVGDSVEKIYEVHSNKNIKKDTNHIWIGLGDLTHYGVITEEVFFVVEDNQVQEIRYKYTAPFVTKGLPTSNRMANELLEGSWYSNHDRLLTFQTGILMDNILDNLWDKQYYTIIAPNKLFIMRIKEGQAEKLMLNFWIDNDHMSIFLIDENGMPIEKSVEYFIRQ